MMSMTKNSNSVLLGKTKASVKNPIKIATILISVNIQRKFMKNTTFKEKGVTFAAEIPSYPFSNVGYSLCLAIVINN